MRMADDLHAIRTGRSGKLSLARGMPRGSGRRTYATSGWENRGFMFWFLLVIFVYWFFLRPLGL
jgi:hypothetical protein